jgi:putative endonuclease
MAGLVPAVHVLDDNRIEKRLGLYTHERSLRHAFRRVTNDLVRRVLEHRSGVVAGFTKRYALKRLVYFEEHQNIQLAIQREHNMKHWSRTWKVRLILRDNPQWRDLFPQLLL